MKYYYRVEEDGKTGVFRWDGELVELLDCIDQARDLTARLNKEEDAPRVDTRSGNW